MVGSRRSNSKPRKSRPRPRPTAAGNWYKRIALGWRSLAFVLGIPILYVGVFSLLPQISVTPGEPLYDRAPLSFPILVENDGQLPVHSVRAECLVHELVDSHSNKIVESEISGYDLMEIGDLGRGGRANVFCGGPSGAFRMNPPFGGAHISLTISFRPDWLPWRGSHWLITPLEVA
jgi:hypothetical protein